MSMHDTVIIVADEGRDRKVPSARQVRCEWQLGGAWQLGHSLHLLVSSTGAKFVTEDRVYKAA